MEFKRCCRCGNFFVSNNNTVCDACLIKDRNDINKLNGIIDNSGINSPFELSINSGVKLDNINRFITNNDIKLV